MKKLLCLLLVVACIFVCVGCGSSNSFAEDKDFMVRDLTEWADAATEIGNTYVRLGNITGAKLMFSYLEVFLAVENIDDCNVILQNGNAITYQYIAEFFSVKNLYQVRAGEEWIAARNEAAQAMLNFSNRFNATLGALQIKYASLPESVKEFKDKYAEKHPESVELITEYYLVASEYVEYILNPTGTLSELSQTIAYYTKQLDQIEKKIQLS